MWTTIFKGMMSRKRRLVGTSTAVVLGVAFLAATLALGDTLRSGFDSTFTQLNAATDVAVRSTSELTVAETSERGTIPADLADVVATIDGVRSVEPEITGAGQLVGADGDTLGGGGPPTEAANWIEDDSMNPWQLVDGRAPTDVPAGGPYEVVIDAESAAEGQLAVGDVTRVNVPEPIDVVVTGIARFGESDSLAGSTYTAFTTDAASEVVGEPGTISSLIVAADDSVNPEQLRDSIAAALPQGVQALTGAELTAEYVDDVQGDFLGMFEVILLAFAGVALVVAAFSIHNTFSILVAQRTRESALLRALGASRRQVLTSVTVEALAVGAIASAAGIAAGYGLAVGLRELVGIDLADDAIVLSMGTIITATVVGMAVTLVASLVPAVKASRVSPLAALRDIAVDRTSAPRARAILGTLIAGAGVATVVTATSTPDAALSRAGLGSLGVLAGAVILGPVVATPVTATIGGVVAALRGHNGRLARRNAMRNPRRTAGSASALMVGTAVVALFTTFGSSIKASIGDSVDRTFGGDLVVSDTSFSGAGMSPELTTAIAELPEVADAAGLGFGGARLEGRETELALTDPATLDRVLDLELQRGSMADVTTGRIAVSEHYAEDHDVGFGDTLPMGFVDGSTIDVTVAAVYELRDSVGDVVVAREDWSAHSDTTSDVVVLIDLAPGVGDAAGQRAVTAVAERFSAPDVQTRDEYLDSVGAQVDAMLTFVYGLLGIAVLIALMGIANTLSLSIHERTRELGLLRAVGQTRRQVRSVVRWESVIVALFGTIGGLALGTFLGWGMMRAIAAQEGFGVFEAPIVPLAVVLAIASGAGVVAAIRPARRAAKTDVLAALSSE